MLRQHLMSGYSKNELILKNLNVQPSTDYVLEFDMLGGSIDMYLFPQGIAAGKTGVQHLPTVTQWTPIRLEFSTVASKKELTSFSNWGIGFLKMLLEPTPRDCIYSDTYIDNVRLYTKDTPSYSLVQNGDFEVDKDTLSNHQNWHSFFNDSESKANVVVDPLRPSNHCLLLPHVIQKPYYSSPMPIETAGFGWVKQSQQPFHMISFTGRPTHHWLLVKSGTGNAVIDDQSYTLQENTLLYIPANQPFYYRCEGGESIEYYWLQLTGSLLPDLLPSIGIAGTCLLSLSDCAALTTFLDAILFLPTNSTTYSLALSGQLQLFLNELERQIVSAKQPFAHRLTIENIAIFIRRYPSKARDNRELAQKCGLSTNYFIRLFKEYFGVSPQQYRIQTLVKRACTLLQDPDMSIKQIAYSFDMDDPLYFSRLFRSVQGVSPREYRRQWQEQWGEKHIENN